MEKKMSFPKSARYLIEVDCSPVVEIEDDDWELSIYYTKDAKWILYVNNVEMGKTSGFAFYASKDTVYIFTLLDELKKCIVFCAADAHHIRDRLLLEIDNFITKRN